MAIGNNNIVSAGTPPSDTIPVWDIVVRIFHWSLVVSFAVVWLTGEDAKQVHEVLGYGILGLIGIRLIWGFIGGKYARFSSFVTSPSTVIRYLKDMFAGKAKRYIGHNPAGGAMIIALLLTLLATGITGWLATTDAYWGVEWVEEVHEFAANFSIVLVVGHIAGVIFASRAHGENLVKAMISGRKLRQGKH
jgi:cytochrome b